MNCSSVKIFAASIFSSGLLTGMLLHRKVTFIYEKKNYCKRLFFETSIPYLSGALALVTVPITLLLSPIIMADYFGNLCLADKIFDEIKKSVDINISRYHQCGPPFADDKPNIYYANSTLIVSIKSKTDPPERQHFELN